MEHRNAPNPLRTLDSGIDPPPSLEARVRGTLVKRGLLRSRAAAAWRRAGAAAAAVAIFVAGYVAGGLRPGATPPAERVAPAPDGLAQYALFLYEDETFDATRAEAALVEEYRDWALALAERGRLAVGEKLTAEGYLLDGRRGSIVLAPRGVTASAGVLTGLFVIRAAGDAEALAIARSSPHLRYGGRIDVRLIEETGSGTGNY